MAAPVALAFTDDKVATPRPKNDRVLTPFQEPWQFSGVKMVILDRSKREPLWRHAFQNSRGSG
jgi:virulence-associated protein VagC